VRGKIVLRLKSPGSPSSVEVGISLASCIGPGVSSLPLLFITRLSVAILQLR
jgi:hypothetical protein